MLESKTISTFKTYYICMHINQSLKLNNKLIIMHTVKWTVNGLRKSIDSSSNTENTFVHHTEVENIKRNIQNINKPQTSENANFVTKRVNDV